MDASVPSPHPTAALAAPVQRVDLGQDEAWLGAFRSGESAALERVFRTYAPLVLLLLRCGVRGRNGEIAIPPVAGTHDQDDLLQEVFGRMFSPNMLLKYDGVGPYSALIRSVTAHVMVDHYRRRGARLDAQEIPEQDTDGLDKWMAHDALPDGLMMQRQEREGVKAFMATLSAEEKAFVEARFMGGLSQEDTARRFSLTRQQVRTSEKHIIKRFKKFWRQRGMLE